MEQAVLPENTAPIKTSAPASERSRTKETLQYAISYLQNSRPYDTKHSPHHLVTPCPDAGLDAFAQLGAFKLNASRVLISVFDRKYQHVIAEATPSSPLNSKIQLGSHKLWLSGTALPRSPGSPSELVLASIPSTHTSFDGALMSMLPVTVVPNLEEDERFLGCLGTEQWPFNRFYAGTPIMSRRGINIGLYEVFDESPRSSLDEDGQQFMRDMADTIMRHLESKAAVDSIHRGSRMVRGLGSFVEGKATLTSSIEAIDDMPGQQEGALNENQQGIQRDQDVAEDWGPQRPDSGHSTSEICPVPAKPELSAAITTNGNIVSTVTAAVQHVPTTPFPAGPASITAADPHLKAIRRTFSRASNVLRESVEVEGALFLDASIGSFGGLVRSRPRNDIDDSNGLPLQASSSSEDLTKYSSISSRGETKYCDIFGFSTTDASSVDGAEGPSNHLLVPERLLSVLLRRYPTGKIFNFDLDGILLSGDSEVDNVPVAAADKKATHGSDGKGKKKVSRSYYSPEGQAKALTSIFPGARSVAVIPLWDSFEERLFAGGFLWTNSSNRVFTVEGELSYLRAFGITIMAEVARLNTEMSDKAKSDFLSSLSHELRSPLHGVIAAVDLLSSTEIDAFQSDVIHTVETSGRTLLDTLDHLLDYSKINTYLTSSKLARKYSRESPQGSSPGGRPEEIGIMSLTSNIQLDVLIEEVTESVFAGYNFQRFSIAQAMGRHTSRDPDRQAMSLLDAISAFEAFGHDLHTSGNAARRGDVLVYLDIDPTVTWNFRSQPGAVRRLLMNLLGNALKFTANGHVWISLRQSDLEQSGTQKARVVLMVSDSGKGIGDSYLRNHLFSPFTQEDHLAPGTGLGLSLVQQISSTLGGSITVTSQLGKGTTACVTLPMVRSSHPVEVDSIIQAHLDQLRGMSICLGGFDQCFERVMEDAPEQPSQVSEAAVMETLCREWLGMRVIPLTAIEVERPDLCLYKETAFTELSGRTIAAKLAIPTVVVCRDAVAAHMFAKAPEKSWVTEFISQPVGARRLARSLSLIWNRWRQRPRANGQCSSQVGTPRIESTPTPAIANEDAKEEQATKPLGGKDEIPEKLQDDVARVASVDGDSFDTTDSALEAAPEAASDDLKVSQLPLRPGRSSGDRDVRPVDPSSKKYLLVDDNDINLRILASFIQRLGHNYDTAVNGQQAVEMYMGNPSLYPCILMDISMPVMNGLEATLKIREHERAEKIDPATVIALTGLASATVQREANAIGMNMFLTKPVNLKSLQKILERYRKGNI